MIRIRYQHLLLVGVLVWMASALAGDATAAGSERPNILFLLVDQWRAKATHFAGDANVRTPSLDRLAGEGIHFRNAVSVCPVCTPYRAALMTGRFPTSTGMFLNDAYLPSAEVCMAEVFRDAGYATAYIGKWHLDGHGRQAYVAPTRRQGWEYWKAAECDHNYNHSHYYTDDSNEKHFWDGYDAFAETKDAQACLRKLAGGERPFLLMVSYGTPHFPHATAPESYKAQYPPEKIRLAPNVGPAMEKRARQESQGYYAHCMALDECVGKILTTLEESGVADKTIVVFTSDHGEMMGSHDCPPTMKQVPWDEAAHVPLLVRFPALAGRQARVIETPLTTPDILPTLCGLTGVAVPKSAEGEDLSGVVRDGKEIAGRAALYMNVAPFCGGKFANEYRAVRTDRYTYVRGQDGPWLLYDDRKDPYQMDNLIGKAALADVQKQLDADLQAQLKRIGDDFRPAEYYIKAWGYEIGRHGSIPYTPGAKMQSPKRKSSDAVHTGEGSS